MIEFTQVYLRPKKILMGSSLAFNLKEGPVRCAKVCDKSWVILIYLGRFVYISQQDGEDYAHQITTGTRGFTDLLNTFLLQFAYLVHIQINLSILFTFKNMN